MKTSDKLVFSCKFPTEMDFMAIQQTEYYKKYHCYSDYLFTSEIYLGTHVTFREYKYGDQYDDKTFHVGIRAVSLVTTDLSFRLNLSVTTSGKTIPEEKRLSIMNIENHDGSRFETSETYDYVPAEEVKIVLRNIQIESYSEEEFETKEFHIVLPTRSKYFVNFSGHGKDYRWYSNVSPKQTTSKEKIFESNLLMT